MRRSPEHTVGASMLHFASQAEGQAVAAELPQEGHARGRGVPKARGNWPGEWATRSHRPRRYPHPARPSPVPTDEDAGWREGGFME